jgi:hypothetical protein
MSEKSKSTSPSAVPVKNWWKTIGIKEELDVISRLEKGERIVHIMCNVGLPYSSVFTIRENADRIKDSAKCLDNIKCQQSQTQSACLCSKTTTVLSEWTTPKTTDISYIFIVLDRNKYVVYIYCIYSTY